MEKQQEQTKQNNTILLNSMYKGSYLDNKLGHEVINLIAADNGAHFIYINSLGKIALSNNESKNPNVECVLLGQLVKKGKWKVIAKASGLKMLNSTKAIILETGAKGGKDNNGYTPLKKGLWEDHLAELADVTYEGVHIAELFPGEKQVLATYKADNLVFIDPRDEVYIYESNFEIKDEVTDWKLSIQLPESEHVVKKKNPGNEENKVKPNGFQFPTTNAYMFFPEKNSHGVAMPDYKKLKEFISHIKWIDEDAFNKAMNKEKGDHGENANGLVKLRSRTKFTKPIMVEIMGKENNELAYSNMINYWLGLEKEVLKKFVTSVLEEKDNNIPFPTPTDVIKIEREKDNKDDIDLLISYGKTRIIIENKIDASISEYDNDKYPNQLVKYRVEQEKKVGKENVHCFLLAPDYRSNIIISKYDDEYKELKYSEMFNFFNKDVRALLANNTQIEPYQFEEFCHALEMHSSSTDNRNYNKMMRRMVEAVKRAK